jgi:hypothetical protein
VVDLAAQVSSSLARQGLALQMESGSLQPNHSFMEALQGVPAAPLLEVVGASATGDTRLQSIKDAIARHDAGGVIQIDLRPDAWWVTRLYLLSALADRFAVDQQLLFRDGAGRLVGLASAKAGRDTLRGLHPALRRFDASLETMSLPPDINSSIDRVIEAWEALMKQRGGERAVGGVVSAQDVRRWFGERLQTRCLQFRKRGRRNDDLLRLLEWPSRFVAVETDSQVLVVDRTALTEHIARTALQELSVASPPRLSVTRDDVGFTSTLDLTTPTAAEAWS